MNTHKKSRKLGFLGAVLALSLSLLGMGTANADDAARPAVGNIDTNKTGSIIIHKYQAPNWTAEGHKNDGSALTAPEDAIPLKNVKFKIQKIEGLDLKKQADWKKLKGLKYENEKFVNDLGDVEGLSLSKSGDDVVTGDDGMVTHKGAVIGAYYVTETDSDNAVNSKDNTPVKVTKKVAPFIVTVPFPNPKAGENTKGWLYDVNVYPKNQVSKTTKVVSPQTPTVTVGSEVKWDVTAVIPETPESEPLKEYRFTDNLDEQLTYVPGTTTAPEVTLGDRPVESQNYTVNYVESTRTLTITFNNGYVKDTLSASDGKTLKISFYTKVVKVNGDKQIPNKGANIEFKNHNDVNWTKVPPETNPVAYFGNYTIKKVSEDGKTPLEKAGFKVYTALKPGTREVDTATVVKDDKDQEITFWSDDQGLVKIENLYYGSSEGDHKDYYVVETDTPAGFQDPTGFPDPDGNSTSGPTAKLPMKITISKDSGSADKVDKTVINIPFHEGDVPNLPLTGAQGKVLLTLAGLAVLAIAAGTAFKTRSRKN
ncbi:LPXTG-motif cell wall anchor domain-containing protein [Arcanobacterium phocae]|uniref:LPXTG-motif cell wall anchor domain-containing protein n=1 Tax=Arcanobacterium phocae TaxID=131112 RepID=A0A1H2LAF9_9ACTO|nr:SpaH/EbpB family LPXTG-anchored major pilin [Arcanobacterium phocae]SDU77804.1 LPXTG-motif cell wall anchor domain-containing protein [Arcanobacterium phocae]